jgi:hypothetical protein
MNIANEVGSLTFRNVCPPVLAKLSRNVDVTAQHVTIGGHQRMVMRSLPDANLELRNRT